MEIVSEPDMRTLRRGGGLCHASCARSCAISAPATATWRRAPALRRQRLGAPSRATTARHALRDQERQLDPLHPAGDRVRGAPPGRDHRGRRQDRPGDPPVRPGQGRDPLDALQGGGARLPLLPRSRPAAAGARPGLGRGASRRACRSCRTPRRPASSRVRAHALRRRRAGRRAGDGRLLRGRRQGPRRQAGRQLGDQRPVRRCSTGAARTIARRADRRRRRSASWWT